MTKTRLVSLVVAVAFPSLASADGLMGQQGTIVLNSDLEGAITRASLEGEQAGVTVETTVLGVQLEPAVDYFVTDRITIGLQLEYGYEKTENESSFGDSERTETDLGVGARVGFFVPFGGKLSLWPRLVAAYTSSETETDTGESSLDGFIIGAEAVFVYHVVPNFYLGAGPVFAYSSLSTDDDVDISGTLLSLALEIGGNF